jgi:ribosome-associated protein
MASRRTTGGGGGGKPTDGGRPRIRSSHGKAEGGARPGPRAAGPRGPARAKPRPNPGPRPAARDGGGKGGARTPRSLLVADGPSQASETGRELAIQIAIAALEKKAVGLEILDVAGKVDYADFLVLMTGRSDRQVAALAQGIEEALAKKGKRVHSVEGMPQASWVLMDFGDVVVHVLQEEARQSYDLDGLWVDARRVDVPPPPENR